MGLHERHGQGYRRRRESIAAEIGDAPAASRRTSRANAAGRTEAAWATGDCRGSRAAPRWATLQVQERR